MLYYAFVYLSLREMFKSFSSDGLEAWKSSFVMGGIEIALCIELHTIARQVFKWSFPVGAPVLYLAMLSAVITSLHFALIEKNAHMKRYEKAFYTKLGKQPKFHFKISGLLFLVVITFSMVVYHFFRVKQV